MVLVMVLLYCAGSVGAMSAMSAVNSVVAFPPADDDEPDDPHAFSSGTAAAPAAVPAASFMKSRRLVPIIMSSLPTGLAVRRSGGRSRRYRRTGRATTDRAVIDAPAVAPITPLSRDRPCHRSRVCRETGCASDYGLCRGTGHATARVSVKDGPRLCLHWELQNALYREYGP